MNKDDKRKILKRIIGLCWFSLMLCMVVKLFGGNYFEVMLQNSKIIDMCNYIDSTFLKHIVRLIQANISFYLYTSSVVGNKLSTKRFMVLEIFILLNIFVKYSFPILGFILDCVLMIVIPFILSKSFKRTFIGFVLLNVFQIISMVTRNMGITILNSTTLVEVVLQVDYYIMLILYYLYSVKMKGVEK